jgi:hypothetical protein
MNSMVKFKRANNILGWIVFLISASVYLLTIEPTVSLWDCGEFIASAFKLQVGHPPGAPLFMIMARFFSLFAGSDVTKVAMMVNAFSALASAFTILFLYWTITHLALRLINYRISESNSSQPNELGLKDKIIVLGSGLVGALAYTFSDTFWFSAVEGEVYATSSLFTAVVFWAVLKWENEADNQYANRWLVLISFLMGLSIGVHLLNLLAIPAIVMVYYFRKNEVSSSGVIKALFVSVLILGIMMYMIIPGVIWLASRFELIFVNGFGLPYHSGVIFYLVLLFGGLAFSLWKTWQKKKIILNTALLMITVIIIGYSSYSMIILRSMADPPMDENNPDNIFSLQYYLNREQYGDRPLVKGQYFNAVPEGLKKGHPTYSAVDGKYKITNQKLSYQYDSKFKTIFPRMYSSDNEHVDVYIEWAGLKESRLYQPRRDANNNVVRNNQGNVVYDRNSPKNPPGFSDNLRFFFTYQLGHMYFRYFMWNFAGRQNDIQGYGDPLNGNWISGITPVDEILIGSQEKLPASDKNTPSRNTYYLLPLLLGLFGLIFQLQRDSRNFWVVMLLFVLTGIAIVIYLNQTPSQPRERDYAYAGSFYAFAIWIGLGVLAIYDSLGNRLRKSAAAVAITMICLILVPGIMANENWDDHDRSGRYTTRDIAYNYLITCAPNAILFTNGDNDTFPLWYAQEVEGIRTDVRVVNLMLLNMDWHIDQIKRKAYESEALPVSLTQKQYINGTRDILFVQDRIDQTADLQEIVKFITSESPQAKVETSTGNKFNFIPTRKFRLPVDTAMVLKNGTVSAKDKNLIVPAIEWTYSKNNMGKSAMLVMDILAHNNWERPIYFASLGHEGTLGLEDYMQLEGFAYRLVPIRTESLGKYEAGRVESNLLYENLMNKFRWGGMNDPDVYLDDFHVRTTSVLRLRARFLQLANALIIKGDTARAISVLDHCVELMPHEKIAFDYNIIQIAGAYYKCKQNSAAGKIVEKMGSICDEKLAYYLDQEPKFIAAINDEILYNLQVLQNMINLCKSYNQQDVVKTLELIADKHYTAYSAKTAGMSR